MRSAAPKPFFKRPWIAPLGVLTVVFLAFSLPPYLGLDPSQSRVPIRFPMHYPMLVAHIFFGSVALSTACLQVWPWLRQHHPAVHRWSGRLYLFVGVLPSGVAALTFAPRGSFGANQEVANTTLALLWIGVTVAGYRMARKRRFVEHREWMVRSFALAFSIVANRLWQVACFAVFAPGLLTGDVTDPVAVAQAVGVSTWMSWVVNLLIAEWWLQRTRSKRRPRRPAVRDREPVSAAAGSPSAVTVSGGS